MSCTREKSQENMQAVPKLLRCCFVREDVLGVIRSKITTDHKNRVLSVKILLHVRNCHCRRN